MYDISANHKPIILNDIKNCNRAYFDFQGKNKMITWFKNNSDVHVKVKKKCKEYNLKNS